MRVENTAVHLSRRAPSRRGRGNTRRILSPENPGTDQKELTLERPLIRPRPGCIIPSTTETVRSHPLQASARSGLHPRERDPDATGAVEELSIRPTTGSVRTRSRMKRRVRPRMEARPPQVLARSFPRDRTVGTGHRPAPVRVTYTSARVVPLHTRDRKASSLVVPANS